MGQANVEEHRASASQRRVDRRGSQGSDSKTYYEHWAHHGKWHLLSSMCSTNIMCSLRAASTSKPP
jgi:hypothetical protein